jgi:hypothetical protein
MATSSRVPIGPVLAATVVVAVVAVLGGLIAGPFNNPPPTPVPSVPPAPPTATLATGGSVHVASIPDLLAALADDANTEIVVADGTYRVSTAGSQKADSLWIGAAFAGRTRHVTVRAETVGGVTIDGGGAPFFGGLSFDEGAHDQTWDGFVFANGTPTETGVVTFGGYLGMPAAHHITLRNLRFLGSLTGSATNIMAPTTDHAIYVSKAAGGPHDLVFDDITVDGSGGLASAIQFYSHGDGSPNAWNVWVRRLTVTGTQQAIIIWDSTLHDIVIDTATVTGALSSGVRYEEPGKGIFLANVTTTGSGEQGFYSTLGNRPPGLTFINDSFR